HLRADRAALRLADEPAPVRRHFRRGRLRRPERLHAQREASRAGGDRGRALGPARARAAARAAARRQRALERAPERGSGAVTVLRRHWAGALALLLVLVSV